MTMERKTLVIERLPQGGFIIAELGTPDGRPVFASLDIGDALDFILDELEPQPVEEPTEEGPMIRNYLTGEWMPA